MEPLQQNMVFKGTSTGKYGIPLKNREKYGNIYRKPWFFP
jgi:hypothetical protein